MASPPRPATAADQFPKEVFIHAGLVFSGHLDVPRLRQAASEMVRVYPELNVYPARPRPFFLIGKWHTPAAKKNPAWDFKHRHVPGKTLADVFPPAAGALGLNHASTSITSLGELAIPDAQAVFNFDGPSINSLGWGQIPVLSFRATLVGREDGGGHTLLGVTVPHFIMDATGVAGIIKTWGRLYRGEKVPTRTEDPHPDPLKLLDSAPPPTEPEPQIKDDERPGKGMGSGYRDFWNFFRDARANMARGITERYVHFPRALLEQYRDEARTRLTGDNVGLSISRLDVFCAMIAKLLAHSSLTKDMDKPLDLYHCYYLSPGLPKDSLPSPYLHNLNTAGWFPLPSSSEVASASVADLATVIRKRLNALRTRANVREQLLHFEHSPAAVPRADPAHGWGIISSWKEVDEGAREGFESEDLVFVRAATENPMGMLLPNNVYPVGDGKGGIFARVTVLKDDWETMFEKSGLS